MEERPQRSWIERRQPWQRKWELLSCGGGEPMKVKIQLRPEVYDYIRTLIHDELVEQKNRQKMEQLAMKIRGQLDQLSGPKIGPQVVQKSMGGRL